MKNNFKSYWYYCNYQKNGIFFPPFWIASKHEKDWIKSLAEQHNGIEMMIIKCKQMQTQKIFITKEQR